MNLRLHRLSVNCQSALEKLARPAGLEPATPGLEGRCSIQLSYGRTSRLSSQTAIGVGLARSAALGRPALAVGGFGGTAGPVSVQTTTEFVEQFVMRHRIERRCHVLRDWFRRLDGQQIVGEGRTDLVHLAHHEAAKV